MLTQPHYMVLFRKWPPTTHCCALTTSQVQHLLMAEEPLLSHRSLWTGPTEPPRDPTEPPAAPAPPAPGTPHVQISEHMPNPSQLTHSTQHSSPGAVGTTATTSEHTSLKSVIFQLSISLSIKWGCSSIPMHCLHTVTENTNARQRTSYMTEAINSKIITTPKIQTTVLL